MIYLPSPQPEFSRTLCYEFKSKLGNLNIFEVSNVFYLIGLHNCWKMLLKIQIKLQITVVLVLTTSYNK